MSPAAAGRGKIFLDSGAFIALLVARDRAHRAVDALFAHPPAAWSTSVLVLSETYSWFLHRLGEEAARTFRRLVEELPDLEIFDPHPEHREAVWAKLDALRGAQLTYVDASSLVFLEQHRIRTVWGTDHHLALGGAEVIPGTPG